jgi:Lsr2
MAQRTQIVLIDDLDGTQIKDGDAQSITFTWSGVDYSIDLSKANADKFEKAIEPYLEKAQRVGGRRSRPYSSSSSGGQVDTKAVRAWAASNGIELSSRGRVPADVVEKYKSAGN